jgi:hypothetical protein
MLIEDPFPQNDPVEFTFGIIEKSCNLVEKLHGMYG